MLDFFLGLFVWLLISFIIIVAFQDKLISKEITAWTLVLYFFALPLVIMYYLYEYLDDIVVYRRE